MPRNLGECARTCASHADKTGVQTEICSCDDKTSRPRINLVSPTSRILFFLWTSSSSYDISESQRSLQPQHVSADTDLGPCTRASSCADLFHVNVPCLRSSEALQRFGLTCAVTDSHQIIHLICLHRHVADPSCQSGGLRVDSKCAVWYHSCSGSPLECCKSCQDSQPCGCLSQDSASDFCCRAHRRGSTSNSTVVCKRLRTLHS